MAKERCLKKTFQDSLEDIKERMKEKRAKGLAKAAKVKAAYSSKTVKMNNKSVSVKSFQENNTELALALEAEKAKSRQAQELILHLKREHQRLMFEIFMLRRKLTLQNGRESADNKLSSLKCIIAKVTCNLLETAKLLGPAQALCSGNSTSESFTEIEKQLDDIQTVNPLKLHSYTRDSEIKGIDTEECEEDNDYLNCIGDDLGNSGRMTSMPKGKRSCLYPTGCTSDVENLNENRMVSISHLHRNVSTRRRRSNLNVCKEESAFLEDDFLNADDGINNLGPVGECTYTNSGGMETVTTIPSPSKEEFLPGSEMSNVASSTPEPRGEKMPLKAKGSRTGRERARRGRTEKGASVLLKKPWENTKSRTRSRSRERGTNKQTGPSEKMNTSLNSGDAYDFVFEESVHVTPFRQNKQEEEDNNESSSVESEDDLHDSLYVPYKENAKNRSCSDNSTSVPLRPRSKRRIVQQQKKENKKVQEEQANIKKTAKSVLKANLEDAVETPTNLVIQSMEDNENVLPAYVNAENSTSGPIQSNVKCEKDVLITDLPIKQNTDESDTPPTPRFRLSDVTNLSGCSNVKKLSCPLLNKDERKTYASPTRKRRCTVSVNYAEPNLSAKLRRGDRFTDTEFLNSPIYKQKDAQKSFKKNSLSRYNEAFVGCSS